MLNALAPERWNYSTAAHLLSRAGFGGPPSEIEELAGLGLEGAVSRLVDFEKTPDSIQAPGWAKPDPERFARLREMRDASAQEKMEMRREEQRAQRENINELRDWWLRRMAGGPRPLQEKLVLFWHGHFATSAQKVRNGFYMWRQNEIFRRHAAGEWLTLLTEVSKDPAMLVWLDQAQSKKERPNENFAREVMELFALGEGHYTEKDVTEAARAFTGWTLNRLDEEFQYRPNNHDGGVKTIFGKSSRFKGEEVLRLIVDQPQASRFITAKIWSFFAGENPGDDLVEALAAVFRKGGREFKPLLRAMFLSEEFYDSKVLRQQVKSPAQWLVGTVRMLERDLPAAQLCATALRQLGQDLLVPPNVKGWDGGLSWITTSNLIHRYNYASFLVLGENPLNPPKGNNRRARRMAAGGPVNARQLVLEELRANKSKVLAALEKRFIQGELQPESRSAVRAFLEAQGEIDDVDVLHAARMVLSTPEFQLA